MKQVDIAKRYGMKTQTLSDLLRKAEKIKRKANLTKHVLQQTRERKLKFDDVNEALYLWFTEVSAIPGVVIDGEMMRMKANEFLHHFHSETSETISQTWIERQTT